MTAELNLVTELAIILISAATFTIISKALKQPVILGYLIAGFIIGPNLGLFPQFSAESVHEWSEIGIIFLLFGLGLEFSFKKLIKIGSSALIAAVVKCIGMFVVGYVTGHLLGWTSMESIFLGGLMGMSSTTIIIKAYKDMGLEKKPFAPLVFGSLVFEDLIAVLLLVLLSTIAVTGQFSGREMLMAVIKLAFFIILWFLIGIYLIPTILRKAKKYLSDEIVLLVSVGLCFLMVVLANLVGFSSALGAFVMGSILAETIEGERILKVTANIKDLFGAVFFVSVGMMFDPQVVADHWLLIIILVIVTISGILLFSTIGVLLSGKGLDIAVHSGCSLAQLGEFAFIIASLGCSLGVLRDFIYPVIIAVSVVTTFTTPYMIKFGYPATRFVRKVLPARLMARIDPEQTDSVEHSKAEQGEWRILVRTYLLRLLMYGVILVGIIMGAKQFLPGLVERFVPASDAVRSLLCCGIVLLVMLPFLVALTRNSVIKEKSRHLLEKNPHNRWPVFAMILFKQAVVIMFVIAAIDTFCDVTWWIILIALPAVAVFILMSNYSLKHFNTLESTFLGNLNEKEEYERRETPVSSKLNNALAGYDIELSRVEIEPDFSYAGKTLREMPFRHVSGVNIVKIKRGSRSITIPSGDEVIFPGDILLAVGTKDQLERFCSTISDNTIEGTDDSSDDFAVKHLALTESSVMTGKTLRELDMRKASCMVVSVNRGGKAIANPDPDFRFEAGDVVCLAGEKGTVEWYS